MHLTVEDVSEDVLERVLNSRGFRKMVLYQHLAEGIKALEEDGNLKGDLAARIAENHSSIRSAGSVEEVLDLLVGEVQAFTEPLTDEADDDPVDADDLEDLFTPTGETNGDGGEP